MEYGFIHKNSVYRISLESRDGKTVAETEDGLWEVDVRQISPGWLSLMVGNRSYNVFAVQDGRTLHVSVNGEIYTFSLPDEQDADAAVKTGGAAETKRIIAAPMPGSVLKICVKEGDAVTDGQCLAIVEAMKMETELCSTIVGRVKKVHAAAGQQVDAGEVLIELEDDSESG
ncbi:MAG: biotin/lipoyl-containing protein [bacterium]